MRPVGLIFFSILAAASTVAQASAATWVTTWMASPEWADPDPKQPLLNIDNQTVRERVRVSVGGTQTRVQFSNEYGTEPLQIGSATIASPEGPTDVRPPSILALTFKGHASVTIPVGGRVMSDATNFRVSAGAELAISVYFRNRIAAATFHELALKRAVISPPGDHTRAAKINSDTTSRALICVSAVQVPASPSQRVIVMFGDSIVDGYGSTFDADRNWSNDLFRRLQGAPGFSNVAVVNAGIGGNRLLHDGFAAGTGFGAGFGLSALARFDKDALAVAGVTHIVLLEGINDIGFPGANLEGRYFAPPADAVAPRDLIDAYRSLASRAHAHGVKLIVATLAPFEGVDLPGYYADSKEAVRQAVNAWIRTSPDFDGVVDVDSALRDPDHPSKLLPHFASKDQFHPNDLGYQAMADTIELSLFR